MIPSDLEQGKTWVEHLLRELADELGIKIDDVQWHRGPNGFSKGYHILLVRSGTDELTEHFSNRALEDHKAPDVALALRQQLRSLVTRFRHAT